MSTFLERLRQAQEQHNSWLCVGLDPVVSLLPAAVQRENEPLLAFARAIVEATADLVCAYKPNLAFWLAQGPQGLAALRSVRRAVPADLPVILDGKFGDVGHTAEAYARFAFDWLDADAATVNPYLGFDGVRPFLERPDRGAFLLTRTSNRSAPELQDRPAGARLLYEEVARLATEWDAQQPGDCGLVVGATYPEEMARLRALAPYLAFLVPGVGTQGGDLGAAATYGPTQSGIGPVVNVSRAILYASQGSDFVQKARSAALELRQQINQARAAEPSMPRSREWGRRLEKLTTALFDAGCIQFGSFTLKSGLTSPVYIDLRLLASHPTLLTGVAQAMAQVARGLTFDRIAAVPYAGLPIGVALAMETGRPLIYPRREIKEHGTHRAVEGAFATGDVVLIVDDLITRGDSKLEAIQSLEEAGLVVNDVLVLIDREQGGRTDLARRGYRLHAVLTLSQMLDTLCSSGRVTATQQAEVLEYLRKT